MRWHWPVPSQLGSFPALLFGQRDELALAFIGLLNLFERVLIPMPQVEPFFFGYLFGAKTCQTTWILPHQSFFESQELVCLNFYIAAQASLLQAPVVWHVSHLPFHCSQDSWKILLPYFYVSLQVGLSKDQGPISLSQLKLQMYQPQITTPQSVLLLKLGLQSSSLGYWWIWSPSCPLMWFLLLHQPLRSWGLTHWIFISSFFPKFLFGYLV